MDEFNEVTDEAQWNIFYIIEIDIPAAVLYIPL